MRSRKRYFDLHRWFLFYWKITILAKWSLLLDTATNYINAFFFYTSEQMSPVLYYKLICNRVLLITYYFDKYMAKLVGRGWRDKCNGHERQILRATRFSFNFLKANSTLLECDTCPSISYKNPRNKKNLIKSILKEV